MRRVLVVNHDLDLADQEVDSLRRAGYIVEQCSGPIRGPCPVLSGLPCPWADRADVLVYDVWATGDTDGGRQLIHELRTIHPEIPIVLTAPGIELDWVQTEGPDRVTPLVGALTGERLAAAIETAIAGADGDATPGPK